MDYKELYKQKLKTVDEALSVIKSGDVIMSSLCCQEPAYIFKNLHKIADRGVKDVLVYNSLNMGMYPFMVDDKYKETFGLHANFMFGPNRASHKVGFQSYYPGHLHNASARWAEVHRPTVFIGAVTPMDNHGFMRFSLCNIIEWDMMELADIVILEVNPNIPTVGGQTEVHISQVDYLVESNEPLPIVEPGPISKDEETIGQYVASLINDGDTIQLGIGGIPDAAAKALMDKHDLGIHTELFTNSMADLVEAGVVTNRKKTYLQNKMVATFAMGNRKLYDMLDNNPSAYIMRGAFVNDPRTIAKNDNMVSVNTAIEVDLSGQICSETVGTRQYSGSGGQADTAYGAVHSKGGRSIIALKSTAKDGKVSTINAIHTPGAVVTLSRNNIDYIVTEYGIAAMRGRTVGERVNNLIAVAHPDFRAQLKADAQKLMLW